MKGIVRIPGVLETSNVMTTLGKEYIAQTLASGSAYGGTYIAIGTGNTAEQASDTALVAEVGSRVQGTLSSSGNTFTLDVTFPPGNPATEEAITEAGLYTAATGGTLIARTTFPVVTKQTSDSIRLQWEITVN